VLTGVLLDCVRRCGGVGLDGGVLGERGRESRDIWGGVVESEWLLREAMGRTADLDLPRRIRVSSNRIGPNELLASGLWGALVVAMFIGPLLPPRPRRLGRRSIGPFRSWENPGVPTNGGPNTGSSINSTGDDGEEGSAKSAIDEGSIVRGDANVDEQPRLEGMSAISRSNMCCFAGGVLVLCGPNVWSWFVI